VVSIDQVHAEVPLCEHLKQRNPVHAGGFHRHGSTAALFQPIGELLLIDSECMETPNGPGISIWWNGEKHLCGTNVDAGSVCFYHGQRGGCLSLGRQCTCSLVCPCLGPGRAKGSLPIESIPVSAEAVLSSLY
jgi:hypothetical protein